MADRRAGALGLLSLGGLFFLLLGGAAPPPRWEAPPRAEVASVGGITTALQVDLNTASRAELEALPGVGPALAARIEAGRPYSSVRQLDRVKGIGPKTLAKLTPLVRVN